MTGHLSPRFALSQLLAAKVRIDVLAEGAAGPAAHLSGHAPWPLNFSLQKTTGMCVGGGKLHYRIGRSY